LEGNDIGTATILLAVFNAARALGDLLLAGTCRGVELDDDPIFGSVIALVSFTVSAVVAAGGVVYLVYFACIPSSTPWTSLPEYRLDGWVMFLALVSLVAGGVALARRNSRR